MTVTWKCGHKGTVPAAVDQAPQCPTCGERIITRVANATPRFTGACTGPLVQKVSA